MEKNPPPDSAWRLRVDLASAKVLIWAASVGRDVELSPDTHLYLATRYDRLAQLHRLRGRLAKARRLARLAAEHYLAGGWSGPPYAAALAMPRPERWVIVDAIARSSARDDVA